MMTDSDGEPCRYLNRYRCDDCGVEWEDQWSCMCDDECPKCGRDFTPYESEDLIGRKRPLKSPLARQPDLL